MVESQRKTARLNDLLISLIWVWLVHGLIDALLCWFWFKSPRRTNHLAVTHEHTVGHLSPWLLDATSHRFWVTELMWPWYIACFMRWCNVCGPLAHWFITSLHLTNGLMGSWIGQSMIRLILICCLLRPMRQIQVSGDSWAIVSMAHQVWSVSVLVPRNVEPMIHITLLHWASDEIMHQCVERVTSDASILWFIA